jgi:mRNA interferase MazF
MTQPGSQRFPLYGEVWIVEMDPVVDSEIGKRRPALIVSNDQNNQYADTVTVLPITSQPPRRRYLYEVLVPAGVAGLSRNSRVKANMIRTVDKSRLLQLMGTLPQQYYPEVNTALKIHLNVP